MKLKNRPKNYLLSNYSYYYFRIFYSGGNNDNLIIPLDSNLATTCELQQKKDGNFFCSFKVPSTYNIFNKEFFAINSDQNEDVTIHYQYIKDNKTRVDNNCLHYFENKNNETDFDYLLLDFIFKTNLPPTKTIISTFSSGAENITLNFYSQQVYKLIKGNNSINMFNTNNYYNYSLSFKYIKGTGSYKYSDSVSILSPNLWGRTISVPVLGSKVEFRDAKDLVFYLKNNFIMRFGYNEIIHGESMSEYIEDKTFPMYYYIGLDNNDILNEANIRILSKVKITSEKILNNYIIEGYLLDQNNLTKKINGELKNLNNEAPTKYFQALDNCKIKINTPNDKTKTIFLIKIDSFDRNIKPLVYITSMKGFRNILNKTYILLPIDRYIIGTYNDSNNSDDTDKDIRYYFKPPIDLIETKNKSGKKLIIEFSSNQNLCLELKIYNNSGFKSINEIKYKNGLQKYPIEYEDLEGNEIITVFIKYHSKGTYILRYYYITHENEYSYEIDRNIIISKTNDTDDTKSLTRSLTFGLKKIIIKYNNNQSIVQDNNNIKILISAYLFDINEMKNPEEELGNIAPSVNEPEYESHMIEKYSVDSGDADKYNIIFKNLKKDKFKYILKILIKIKRDNSEIKEEFLSFSKDDIDLKPYLKDSDKFYIIFGIVGGVIIITIITVVSIVCYRIRKEKKSLENNLMSAAFSQGITDDSIIRENSKKKISDETFV